MNYFTKHVKYAALLILLTGAIASCKKKKEEDPQPQPQIIFPTAAPQLYFIGTLGGSKFEFKEGVDKMYDGITAHTDGYTDENEKQVSIFTMGSLWSKLTNIFNGDLRTYLVIEKTTIIHSNEDYYTPTVEDINNAFPIEKSTTFYKDDIKDSDGWEINYYDDNEASWKSSIGDQTDSYVTLTAKKDTVMQGKKMILVTGSLHSTLYDGNGNTKVIDGKFKHLQGDYDMVRE